ncbi:MAG: STAS domain-containing protein [Solirubrobacterales bacterium]|nr:STAS domain-containing protein [Solirubrobacterales bacterium]
MVESLDVLTVALEFADSAVVIRLSGELDLSTGPQLGEAFADAAVSDPALVVLDLHALTFIDAAGLRAVLRGNQQFDKRLIVRGASSRIRRLFTVAGVERELQFDRPPLGLVSSGREARP